MADYQSVLDLTTFLNTGIHPARRALCDLFSLRTAVCVALVLDVLLGALYVVESILLVLVNGLLPSEFNELIVSLVGNGVSIVAVPFAVIGMAGMYTENQAQFHLYFLYKSFEVLFLCIYDPATSYIYCYGQGWMCELVTLLCVFGQKIGIDVYVLYLVWSMDVTMKVKPEVVVRDVKSLEMAPLGAQETNS